MASAVPPAGQELLDDFGAPAPVVRESLRNIARANRWLGGVPAARFGLARLLHGSRPDRLVLLDVGTGYGDVPAALARWLGQRGTVLDTVVIERHPVACRVARERGLRTVLGDGLTLPLRSRSVDIALVSQVAHHFPPEGAARLALEATRVARVGVIIADLRPSRIAAWGFRLASRVLGFDPITRADGVLSLRRGFTAGALRDLLGAAGIAATVVNRPGARVVAYWSTPS